MVKHIAENPSAESACSAPYCLDAPVEGAPVPLCPRCLRETYEFAQDVVNSKWADELQAERDRALSVRAEHERRVQEIDAGSREGWVYFIRKGNEIKIGFSGNPKSRFKSLQPDEILHLEPGTIRDEQRCHKAFAHIRLHHEYFAPAPDLLAFIADLKANAA